MDVTVRIHERVRRDIGRWLASLPGAESDQALLGHAVLQASLEILRLTAGRPPEARPVEGINPPEFWLTLSGGWRMRYRIREKRMWFRRRRIDIVVTAFRHEPLPEAPL